jgi:hypothetical protein
MLKRNLSLLGLGLLIFPAFLHADTITTFALDGFTFQTPATLTGTITIDVTTGITTGINATYTAGSLTDEFTVLRTSPVLTSEFASVASINIPTNDLLVFVFPTSSLVGYTGGPVCFYYIVYPYGTCPVGPFNPPMAYVGSDFTKFPMESNFIQTGTLDPIPTTTTSEPSNFVLVGSGLIGALSLTGALRRKFCSAPER